MSGHRIRTVEGAVVAIAARQTRIEFALEDLAARLLRLEHPERFQDAPAAEPLTITIVPADRPD